MTPVIPEGENCTLTVSFIPSSQGVHSATLNIASDAANSPALELLLTGTAVLPKHSLTVNIDGSGSVNNLNAPPDFTCAGSNCTGSFDEGTAFTLRGTPSANYEFTGWSGGGCSGVGDCSLTLNADTTVSATFRALPLVMVSGSPTEYFSLQVAYDSASSNCTISARNVEFSGGLNLGLPVDFTLEGGLEMISVP